MHFLPGLEVEDFGVCFSHALLHERITPPHELVYVPIVLYRKKCRKSRMHTKRAHSFTKNTAVANGAFCRPPPRRHTFLGTNKHATFGQCQNCFGARGHAAVADRLIRSPHETAPIAPTQYSTHDKTGRFRYFPGYIFNAMYLTIRSDFDLASCRFRHMHC